MDEYTVDWERRRLLSARRCVHEALLTEFCADCGSALDSLAAVAALRDWQFLPTSQWPAGGWITHG